MKAMALFILMFSSTVFANSSAGSSVTLWGTRNTAAGILTESLIAEAKTNSQISIDTSTYTITKVEIEQNSEKVTCTKSQFGAPPPTYQCVIETL